MGNGVVAQLNEAYRHECYLTLRLSEGNFVFLSKFACLSESLHCQFRHHLQSTGSIKTRQFTNTIKSQGKSQGPEEQDERQIHAPLPGISSDDCN